MMPLAPGVLSGTTLTLAICAITVASLRPIRSEGDPGPVGSVIVMWRAGYACAEAVVVMPAPAASAASCRRNARRPDPEVATGTSIVMHASLGYCAHTSLQSPLRAVEGFTLNLH